MNRLFSNLLQMTPDDQVIREVDRFLIGLVTVFFYADGVLAFGQATLTSIVKRD